MQSIKHSIVYIKRRG